MSSSWNAFIYNHKCQKDVCFCQSWKNLNSNLNSLQWYLEDTVINKARSVFKWVCCCHCYQCIRVWAVVAVGSTQRCQKWTETKDWAHFRLSDIDLYGEAIEQKITAQGSASHCYCRHTHTHNGKKQKLLNTSSCPLVVKTLGPKGGVYIPDIQIWYSSFPVRDGWWWTINYASSWYFCTAHSLLLHFRLCWTSAFPKDLLSVLPNTENYTTGIYMRQRTHSLWTTLIPAS